MQEHKKIQFILKRSPDGSTVIRSLLDNNVGKLLDYLLVYYAYNTRFPSTKTLREKICTKLEFNQAIYYRSLEKLVQSGILIKEDRSCYLLNNRLIEIQELDKNGNNI